MNNDIVFIECAHCQRKTPASEIYCTYCNHNAHRDAWNNDKNFCRYGDPDGEDDFNNECECDEWDKLP